MFMTGCRRLPWHETSADDGQAPELCHLFTTRLTAASSLRSIRHSARHCGRCRRTHKRATKESDSMRRTVLSALALACTAVLASTAPALADGTTPSPATTAPSATAVPTPAEPSAEPSTEPTRTASPVPSAPSEAEPTRAPEGGQVSVVPSGAPNTGVGSSSSSSGTEGGLIGGGAAAVLLAGGATVFVVRRRRAHGA